MRKKLISLILTVAMVVSCIPVIVTAEEYTAETLLYSENFESYASGSKPQMDIYESTGSITVETVGSTKALHIKTNNGISNTVVEKKIDRIEKKPVDVTLKFMQTLKGSSDNKVIGLYDGDASLDMYADKGAFYIGETKLCDYDANKWYEIKLKLDLYKSFVDVYVNGTVVSENIAVDIKGIDKFIFEALQPPGFYIDDISIKSEQIVSGMSIECKDMVVIPKNGENEYTFSAYCKDENGEKFVVSNIDWTVSPAVYPGITVTENAEELLIKVASGTNDGEIEVKASLGGALQTTKIVELKKVAPTDIRIDGAVRIAGESGESYKYGYEVVMNDQNGDTVENFGDFTWTMKGLDGYAVPSSIKLDENTGIITVTDQTPFREFIELKATSVADPDNVWQTKKILVTNYDSLLLDNMRYDAVKSHIDNVMKYATDPYEDTPLLTDVINVGGTSIAPGGVIIKSGDKIITNNLGVQSGLLRSMINLSNFENDDTYRQKVTDIYKYVMDISPAHYLIEGGHMAIDLKIKANNPYSQPSANTALHETKGGYTYWTPLFWADYDRAETLLKSLFAGHSRLDIGGVSAKNMQVTRHWYTAKSSVNASNADSYWQNTSIYDWDRKGAVTGVDIANFLITYGEMLALLAQYYEAADAQYKATESQTEKDEIQKTKDKIIEWADIIYSSLDQTGWNPITGEYHGMFNETNGSKYMPDWSNIHETWEKYGRHWYDSKNYSSGMVPGDRFFTNTILSDRDLRPVSEGGEGFGPSSDGKSWVDMYPDNPNTEKIEGVNEDNWMYFLEPYMFCRENSCINSIAPGLFLLCDTLPDDNAITTKIIEKYVNSIYNYLKLRYNFNTSFFDAKMSWGLDIGGWEVPHRGYYYGEGGAQSALEVTGKAAETGLISSLATICYQAKELADKTDPDELAIYTAGLNGKTVKRKDQLMEQAEFIWSVLRNLCKVNFLMGDIGDPFNGVPSDLNLATTSTDPNILNGAIRLYQLYDDENLLKFACNLSNNIMASEYNESIGVFQEGPLLTPTSYKFLLPFLNLEALLLDDYERLIEAELYSLPSRYWDVEYIDEYGKQANGVFLEGVLQKIDEPSTKQRTLIIEAPFKMKAGESRKIKYTVLPYDAPTGVWWDVSDPEIADITTGGVITAHKHGTVDIRCVSSSVQGLESETITVTVE